MVDTQCAIPTFLKRIINFDDGRSFELLQPLTDYRACHDGSPLEGRIVFTCRQLQQETFSEELVMKIKVQLPAAGQVAEKGPSTTTAHELKALSAFRDATTAFAPHLVGYHHSTQDEHGPFPGGFLTFTVMTKMPGHALFGKYWSMTSRERDEIIPNTVQALQSIHKLGIEPADRGLRNVIWDPEGKSCSIVDFELWDETNGVFVDEKAEMQRWGLIRVPPAKDHWAAWNQMYR